MTGTSRFLASGDEAGTAPEDRGFRPDVEGLRALAIVLVVLFHVGIHQVQGGFVGVDVFFVISGFVITGVLLRERAESGHNSFLRFYARRARRILPMAILVIVVSLAATDLLAGGRDATLVASDSRWSSIFLANFHFTSVVPTLFTVRIDSPLEQFWSLAVEEQFYLVYPALFIALLALAGRWSVRSRLAVGLTVLVIASFVYSVASSHLGEYGAYNSPFTRAWELALGGLLAVGTAKLERIPPVLAATMTWLGLAGIVAAATTFSLRVTYPGLAAALPVVGTALVIAGGTAVPARGAESLLRLSPFRWLGRWSYSWYLWHWPILAIAAERAHTTVAASPIGKNAALVAVALVVSAATYALVENPLRHSSRLANSPRATLVGAVLLIVTAVAFTFAF